METKKCIKCGGVFLLWCFSEKKNTCKRCIKKYNKEYRLKNKYKENKYRKEYRLENKDNDKQYRKKHYFKNKKKINEQHKEYRLKNKEDLNDRYVKSLFRSLKTEDVPQELIELKREQIIMSKLLKESKEWD